MLFGFHLYPFYAFPDLKSMTGYVQRAERAGYSFVNIPEHVVFPKSYERSMGRDWWDPIVLGTHLADHTEKIRICYHVLILPQHNPMYLAKQIATLDWVSEGRVAVGVGVGWCEDEFRLVGADFHRRGALTDEYIRATRALWTTDPSAFEGKFLKFSDVSCHPKPVQKPHPPVYVGGTVKASVRRAATLGDGWIPMTSSWAEFEDGMGTLKSGLQEQGRGVEGFPVMLILPFADTNPDAQEHGSMAGGGKGKSFRGDYARAMDHIRRCEALGVTHMQVQLPTTDFSATVRVMEEFAEKVIHKL